MADIKIIPKSNHPFDALSAVTEARNAERLFNLHLSRCDNKDAAEVLAKTFERLAAKFKQKTLALSGELV